MHALIRGNVSGGLTSGEEMAGLDQAPPEGGMQINIVELGVHTLQLTKLSVSVSGWRAASTTWRWGKIV